MLSVESFIVYFLTCPSIQTQTHSHTPFSVQRQFSQCIVDNERTSRLSFHFSIVIPSKLSSAIYSSRFNFFATKSFGMLRRFHLIVPMRWVFLAISCLAKSTLVYQLSVHSVWPLPNMFLNNDKTTFVGLVLSVSVLFPQ